VWLEYFQQYKKIKKSY